MTFGSLLLLYVAAIVFGVLGAIIYMFRNAYSKSFVVTLALLPAMTLSIILVVNGNLGTGVAVMGAFSLVRFRSFPGSAREIGAIFFAMALGLCLGAGYLLAALMLFIVVGAMMLVLEVLPFGQGGKWEKELKISIPESLDYEGLFDDVLAKYTARYAMMRVRTVNMGAMYELQYHVTLKKDASIKAFLDDVRVRNGNLNVSLGRVSGVKDEL